MTAVSVANLKANLSAYLEKVKQGNELLVTSHQHPVARVVPLAAGEHLEIQRAATPVSSLRKVRGVKLKFDPLAILLEDRSRR